jgi:hypothetical protein
MTPEQERLLALYADLDAQQRASLMAFAEFLRAGATVAVDARAEQTPEPVEIPQPELVPRPERESVVAALKRLSASYRMLDKSKMLNETSSLVAQHVMEGREAVQVIDELEVLFQRHYESFVVKLRGE